MIEETEENFRDSFTQAMYETRRAFLKNGIPLPDEIVFDENVFKNILRNLKFNDYDRDFNFANHNLWDDGVRVMGIMIKMSQK